MGLSPFNQDFREELAPSHGGGVGSRGDAQMRDHRSQWQVERCRHVSVVTAGSSGRQGQRLGPDGPLVSIKEFGIIPKDRAYPSKGLSKRKS